MSYGLYHHNENVTFNIERCDVDGSTLRISGWIFSEVPIRKVDFTIGRGRVAVGPVATYGLPSNDVERHYGSAASNCRFDETVTLPSIYSPYELLIFRLQFATGMTRDMTVKVSPDQKEDFTYNSRCKRELQLGIGVTTFRRKDSLRRLLNKLHIHTKTNFHLVVADDGSEDGTTDMLNQLRVPYISGVNRGVAWNKNRALYHLNSVLGCDVTVLLEDDTYPSLDGWEEDWIDGAQQYDHMNLAGHWFKDRFITGLGTVEDPIRSTASSGQCVSFSRKAIERVGYFDTRFGRYGFEHVEHSERCIRLGFGGETNAATGSPEFFLIRGGVTVGHMMDFHFASLISQNAHIYEIVKRDEVHRWAWRGDDEMKTFLAEQDQTIIPS